MPGPAIIAKIPWRKNLQTLPIILDMAREVKDSTDKFVKTPAELKERVQNLEESEQKPADYAFKVAEQINDVTNSMKIISDRLTLFITLSIIGLSIGLLTTVILLLK